MDALARWFVLPGDTKTRIFSVAYKTAYLFLSGILIFAGIAKLYNPFPLLEYLCAALPMPILLEIGLVAFIAILETVLGLMLLLKIRVKEILIATGILFSAIFFFSVYAYMVGLKIEAGTFGGIIASHFNSSMLIWNSVCLLISIVLIIKEIELPNFE